MDCRPRLLVADDTLTAQCLQRLLESEFPGVEIATSGPALIEAAIAAQPDVVLLDIGGTALDGFQAMHRLREVSPSTKVVVVTKHDQPEYVSEAIRAGAFGYLLKWCTVSELVTAVRTVVDGRPYLTPSLGRAIAAELSAPSRPAPRGLTNRQREVLQLVAQGRTAKEVASALGLSVKTAVFHKMSIMDKLGLRTTADLTRYALDHGILSSAKKAEPLALPAAASA